MNIIYLKSSQILPRPMSLSVLLADKALTRLYQGPSRKGNRWALGTRKEARSPNIDDLPNNPSNDHP